MSTPIENSKLTRAIKMAILVSALGYCVDIFDIALFGVLRVTSLKSLGLAQDQLLPTGVYILNLQLVGMLLGGVLWGVIGDKIGRIQVLFGSIFIYSIASLANGFIHSVEAYALCRFIAGIGLAGEVGAGVTLVAELMSKTNRGLGTAVVAAAGTFGALLASLTAEFLDWRSAYIFGGLLGIILLFLRVSVQESGIFTQLRVQSDLKRGDVRMLFFSRKRLLRYLACILAGTPLFFAYYVLMTFSPEIGKALGLKGELTVAKSTLFFCIGMTVGDVASGVFSQYLKSRKKALFSFISAAFICCGILLSLHNVAAWVFYLTCIPTGFFIGYWAVYITTAAEQFGTNLRATVATTVPSFVRATPIAMNFLFLNLKESIGVIGSLQLVGLLSFACSFFFLSRMTETFSVDLNFVETKDGTRSLTNVVDPKLEPEQATVGWS